MLSVRNYQHIFITGAGGSVGRALLSWLSQHAKPDTQVLGIDINEGTVFELQKLYSNHPNISIALADVRNADTMRRLTAGTDLIIHLAALKHVCIGEQFPSELIATNLTGLQNVIDSARDNQVAQVIFSSSDKAVYPTNAMGASKLMGESLMKAAAAYPNTKTRFTVVRFGNVLGSNGSVIPLFRSQLEQGDPITLTHHDMSRFVMNLDTCSEMLMNAANLAEGGDILVKQMPVMNILDLAKAMIEEWAEHNHRCAADISIVEIGIQAGEKLHELLMSEEEAVYATLNNGYYSIFEGKGKNDDSATKQLHSLLFSDSASYSSKDVAPMSIAEIRAYLQQLPKPQRQLSTERKPVRAVG